MSLKFGKTIRTLSLSQNYLVLIKKKSVYRNQALNADKLSKQLNYINKKLK